MYQNSILDHLFSLPIVEQVYPSSEHKHYTVHPSGNLLRTVTLGNPMGHARKIMWVTLRIHEPFNNIKNSRNVSFSADFWYLRIDFVQSQKLDISSWVGEGTSCFLGIAVCHFVLYKVITLPPKNDDTITSKEWPITNHKPSL